MTRSACFCSLCKLGISPLLTLGVDRASGLRGPYLNTQPEAELWHCGWMPLLETSPLYK